MALTPYPSLGTLPEVIANGGKVPATMLDLAAEAPLASPTFTGTPSAPTPSATDNSTHLATTAFVKAQGFAVAANNLSDLTSAATARTNLGLGSAATHPASDFQAAGSYSPLAGSAAITTVGTIATGTWQGTPIDVSHLGTGTPASGKYLDGAGAWTALPAAGGTGGTIASTALVLKGDGSGDAVAGTAGTDYVYPGGVSGGQTIDGDTASGGNLTLYSTSHATKGNIYLNGTATKVDASGNFTLDCTGSTPTSPRVIGFSSLPVGSSAQLQIGDAHHGLQLSPGANMQVYGYYGIVFTGNHGFGAPTFVAASTDFGCRFAGAQTNSKVVEILGASGQSAPLLTLMQLSSTSTPRNAGVIDATLPTATDASWTGRIVGYAGDYTSSNTGQREGWRVESDGTQPLLSFFGGSAVAKPTVTGSRGGNAAVQSLLSALAALGLITDSTST
jgi:hypothetical protein